QRLGRHVARAGPAFVAGGRGGARPVGLLPHLRAARRLARWAHGLRARRLRRRRNLLQVPETLGHGSPERHTATITSPGSVECRARRKDTKEIRRSMAPRALWRRRELMALLGAAAAGPALAQFRVEVTGVGLTQLPIAIAPFRGEADVPQKIASIV